MEKKRTPLTEEEWGSIEDLKPQAGAGHLPIFRFLFLFTHFIKAHATFGVENSIEKLARGQSHCVNVVPSIGKIVLSKRP